MRKLDTQLVHAGTPSPRIMGAVSTPVFSSANFEYAGETDYNDLKYIRLNNTPNHSELHQKLATIEGAEAALVASSGMAAISTSLLSVLGPGDHLMVQHGVYGGTHTFLTQDLQRWGVTVSFVDPAKPDTWGLSLTSQTKGFYVETMSNPMVQVGDLPAVVDFCRSHGLVSFIDNTFATPVNFRPLEHGFDLVLHSATKYLNGHSDIVAGAIVGSMQKVGAARHLLNHLGGSLDPHACFLLSRGLKTLALRMERQNANALSLAQSLQRHSRVSAVYHPGLPSHPGHELARKLFKGFGGVVSFLIDGDAQKFFRHLTIPVVAPSLGGVESLVTLPCNTSHAGLSPQERAALGIHDNLIRVAVGIEAGEDLVEDFQQALDAL